jgi:hypothetical protein
MGVGGFMFFRVCLIVLFLSTSVFSLEDILEQNLDVVDCSFIEFFEFDDEHEQLATLRSTCETRIAASTKKNDLKSLLLKKHMNNDFFRYILRDYLRRDLSEARTILMYRVAEESELEDLQASYASRLVRRRTLLRRSNEVPHFEAKKKDINFTSSLRTFMWDGQEFDLKVTSAEKSNISIIKSSPYFDDLRHALHNLMSLGNFPAIEVSLSQKKNLERAQAFDPNFLFQQLYSMIDNEHYDCVMLGDIDSQGKYRKYGYLRHVINAPASVSKIILSPEAKGELLELIKIEGISVLSEKIFLSALDLKKATTLLETSDELEKSIELYKRSLKDIKYKAKWPKVMRAMDQILAKNPYFMSAEVLKDVLGGKVKKELSYASSYKEFNYAFRSMDEGYLTKSNDLSELMSEMLKVKKVIHPAFREMMNLSVEIAKDKLILNRTPRPAVSKKKGTRLSKGGNAWLSTSQRLYKNLRTVRQKRNVLLDQQKVIEEIFER